MIAIRFDMAAFGTVSRRGCAVGAPNMLFTEIPADVRQCVLFFCIKA